MEFKITTSSPDNILEWDKLAELNGNLLASTKYDPIQNFYTLEPFYLHFIKDDKLIAGVKLYLWESKRLPFFIKSISRNIQQIGENIIHPQFLGDELIQRIIEDKVLGFIHQMSPVYFNQSGYWGDEKLLVAGWQKEKCFFDVALIDLRIPEEELYMNMMKNHRRGVDKGEKIGLIFETGVPLNVLIDLMRETYRYQSVSQPNYGYIEHLYKELVNQSLCEVYAVKRENVYLSAALVQCFGKRADYAFGGGVSNAFSSGHFLHWNIFLDLKAKGYYYYSFGQVAVEQDEFNLKFSKGITEFKMRFGAKRVNSFSQKIIFKPISFYIFNQLKKLLDYVNRS